jgi:hypothetical protein
MCAFLFQGAEKQANELLLFVVTSAPATGRGRFLQGPLFAIVTGLFEQPL